MNACFLSEDQLIVPQEQKVGGGQKKCFSKKTFLRCLVAFSKGGTTREHYHFQSKTWVHTTHAYLFSLGPRPTLIQRGEEAYYTSLFIFLWDNAQV